MAPHSSVVPPFFGRGATACHIDDRTESHMQVTPLMSTSSIRRHADALSAVMMTQCGRVCEGDLLEIAGVGAPGYGAVGDRVRVVHVGLDHIVVENKIGRWAKFLGNRGASRLKAAEPVVEEQPASQPDSLEHAFS
jgi:hypothetical protein